MSRNKKQLSESVFLLIFPKYVDTINNKLLI